MEFGRGSMKVSLGLFQNQIMPGWKKGLCNVLLIPGCANISDNECVQVLANKTSEKIQGSETFFSKQETDYAGHNY